MRLEAQAIVLAAGPGMRMTTLTNKSPKSLLPLGTLPMIVYPLQMLQEAGFTEATVVVSSGVENNFVKLAEQYGLKLKLEIAVVNTSDYPCTADSLRHIAPKIKKGVDDVVIVSSDLVTDVALQPIMDQHRSRGAALTMLTAKLNTEFTKAQTPGPKTKHQINSDIICRDGKSGQLMYAVVGGDYDDNVDLSSRVMKNSASMSVSTSLLDAHLYVMKRWMFDYILSEESPCNDMGSLRAEIIPHVISRQFTKPPSKEREGRKLDIHDVIENDEYMDLIKKFNTSVVESPMHNSGELDSRICYTYNHPGLCVRANTLNAYWQLNRKMHSIFKNVSSGSTWDLKHLSADVNEKAQVSDDSLIGAGSVVCEKTNISSSVIGNHCRINPLTRISNSVLASHVTIAQGCVIENSLIAADIEKKCTIQNCIVTDPNRITENKSYSNEVLEASADYA